MSYVGTEKFDGAAYWKRVAATVPKENQAKALDWSEQLEKGATIRRATDFTGKLPLTRGSDSWAKIKTPAQEITAIDAILAGKIQCRFCGRWLKNPEKHMAHGGIW